MTDLAERRGRSPCDSAEAIAYVAHEIAQVVNLADWRALRSWIAAVEWLNARGYAAAVPASVAAPLRRRGLSVWVAGQAEAAG